MGSAWACSLNVISLILVNKFCKLSSLLMSGGEGEESFRAALDQFFHEHVETFQLLYRIARVHVGATYHTAF